MELDTLFFYKGTDGKYFSLREQPGLCCDYLTLSLLHRSMQRQHKRISMAVFQKNFMHKNRQQARFGLWAAVFCPLVRILVVEGETV